MNKLNYLEKYLQNHKSTCSIHTFSGKRNCSCGRDLANEYYIKMKNRLMELDIRLKINEKKTKKSEGVVNDPTLYSNDE